MIGDYIEIPEIFWSFETGAPFSRCKICEKDLFEAGTNYLIEKALRNGEVIFEYAVCISCQQRLQQDLSQETTLKIGAYFAKSFDLQKRRVDLLEQCGLDADAWLGHCAIKGFPVRECEDVQIYGHCIDEALVFTGMPFALCGEVIEDIMELISPQSLGAIKDLSDSLFGLDLPQGFFVL